MKTSADIRVIPMSESSYPCDCCGRLSRTIWGELQQADGPAGFYFCQWTVDGPEHDANVDIIAFLSDADAAAGRRALVSLLFRRAGAQSAFMVIDAEHRHGRLEALCETALARDQVIGTSRAAHVFALVDAIWMQDARIGRLLASE